MCKRRLRRKSCTGKIKYTDYWSAYKAYKHLDFGGSMRVYKCNFCSGYHIGHYNKNKVDKIRGIK